MKVWKYGFDQRKNSFEGKKNYSNGDYYVG